MCGCTTLVCSFLCFCATMIHILPASVPPSSRESTIIPPHSRAALDSLTHNPFHACTAQLANRPCSSLLATQISPPLKADTASPLTLSIYLTLRGGSLPPLLQPSEKKNRRLQRYPGLWRLGSTSCYDCVTPGMFCCGQFFLLSLPCPIVP